MLAQSLGAELAAIDRVFLISTHSNGFTILDADQHATAYRAISTGGLDPFVGHAGRRYLSKARVDLVGVGLA